VETAEQTSSTLPTSRKVLCAIYGAIALAALIATWSQNVAYAHNASVFLSNFLRDTKVTAASRSITVDILLFLLAATILMVIEARKHNVRFVWLYVLGSFAIAVSVTFPLFLIARELRLGASEPPRLNAVDTSLLALLAIVVGALTIWVDVL
jgi:Terpene cyclase DEP1